MNTENENMAGRHEENFVPDESSITENPENAAKKVDNKSAALPAQYTGEAKDDPSLQIDDPVAINNIASDRNAKIGEAEIVSFDQVFPNHEALEDTDEIQSTDDV